MNRGRILAVDDEETVLEIYRDTLEPLGWEVHTAKSFVEAVARLDEGHWGVVLLDQRLRGAASSDDEGLGLIEEAERRSPGAAVIIVTGYASPEAIDRAFAAGAYDYVEKTPSFKTLLRVKVEHAMELQRQRWLVHASDAEAQDLWAQLGAEANSHRKGRLLEDLMELLLKSIPGFIVTARKRGLDEELDLMVRNETADPWWSKEGSYLLVECKNWSRPCDPKELSHLLGKLQHRFGRAKLGFFVAAGGFTRGFRSWLVSERKSEHLVVPIDRADLQRLVEAADRSEMLKALHQRAIEITAEAE
ncbi:MAG: response regulator [Myxococcales bacterium]|nr:response regulator [Myxococcales bacterium]